MPTLEEALRETAMRKWQGRRCYATNMSQARQALDALYTLRNHRDLTPTDVTPHWLQTITAKWYAQGLAPATINKRLNCLSAMGVSVEGCRVREPKVLKWWLSPANEARLCHHLEHARGTAVSKLLAYFIRWTARTGLRIEESLRLTDEHFHQDADGRWEVTVPGLKTADSQATLPVSAELAPFLLAAVADRNEHTRGLRLFPISYERLQQEWDVCRAFLGVSDNPTATLKALRRSAARHLHIAKGMPLDMVRQYLRHEDIETTMGYLRLTGGYGTEEMRKWL